MAPFEGDDSDENLRMEKNLNDPLSSDAWTPTFVYESTPGQSGYDSVDTSIESVHSPNQSDIGEVPDRAGVAVVPISWIPAFTSTPELQFNQGRIKEAKELEDYNGAS